MLKPWTEGAVVIGCRHNTMEFVRALRAHGRSPSGIVTISEETAKKNKVPTWRDLGAAFPEIPTYVAESYGLKSDADRELLVQTSAAFGICIGWQRLLPDWFLARCRNGVFGMHACQYPLPRGRGRSPLNWSLIHGADTVLAHVLRYNNKPDAGDLLDVVPIAITPHDDIHSLQQKCRVVFNRIAVKHWEQLESGAVELFAGLVDGPDLEYPKRVEADGKIDWSWCASRVHDWVRAQSRPYPGAFTAYGDETHKVWRAVPFVLPPERPATPGTILDVFEDRSLVVQCGDAPVHLLDHEIPVGILPGEFLS